MINPDEYDPEDGTEPPADLHYVRHELDDQEPDDDVQTEEAL